MRKDVAVLMVLWVMCIPYATFICASATPNKLDTLKAFLRKKILYDEYVPVGCFRSCIQLTELI